jgi:flavodoxin I
MQKIGVFYGSSSGTTEDIAQRIADRLGVGTADVHNVGNTPASAVGGYEVLILGTSTWGLGDLQDDWDSFLPKLKRTDLSGKIIALFGTGDSSSFSDTFCDGMGIIYNQLKTTGATFAGAVSTEGYSFDSSVAAAEGSFVGLALDEINEGGLTDKRIAQWTEQLKAEGL